MRKGRRIYTIIMAALALALLLTACQPTPEIAPVQNKGDSLIDMISGDYDFTPENAAALNGQTWSEQVFEQDDITVSVDAQIITQDVKAYPAIRTKEDKERFMKGAYLKNMIDYFFAGDQLYYRKMDPAKKEAAIRTFWFQQFLSSGTVPEEELDDANQKLEYYQKLLASASDDIPFDIKEDPCGEKHMIDTGIDNLVALVSYPSDGISFVEMGNNHLVFIKQTSIYNNYEYEVGLDSLNDAPESIDMDAQTALQIAEDSVNTVAKGDSMKLVRIATICRVPETMPEATEMQKLNPDGLVFYFMRSYQDAKPTYTTISDFQFNLNGSDPQYRQKTHPEYIRVIVYHTNIVDWMWLAPDITGEVISDDVPLMPFEQVKDIFKQQVKNYYAACSYDGTVEIHIDKIALGLMKISEKDSDDDCLIIPVWDFIGTEHTIFYGYDDDSDEDHTYLTINAIDGTIIDR